MFRSIDDLENFVKSVLLEAILGPESEEVKEALREYDKGEPLSHIIRSLIAIETSALRRL